MNNIKSSTTKETKDINDRFLEKHENVAQISDAQFERLTQNITQNIGPALENLAKGPDEDITF